MKTFLPKAFISTITLLILFGCFSFSDSSFTSVDFIPDKRNILTGWEIPTETYSDQPYIVKTDDGAWLCIVTTGGGHEGASGQHVVTVRSTDQGKTWSEPVDVESADGPEASYSVMLKVTSGRIYAFYNHNTDNLRRVKADNPPYKDGYCYRVDSQGYFVFKYSDDHGHSWSEKRYSIPIREMEIDRQNAYGGKIQFFWNVGKPFIFDGAGYVSLHKVGGFGYGFFTTNEGVLLKSNNILTEKDPDKIKWETLPDGDYGLRTPPGGGPISAEQSYSILSDGSIYCVYRTIDGHPVFTYSRDGGHTWDTPQYKKYEDGRLMKHPRAANFAWKCENGKYLYWFHNHGGRFIREHPNRRSMAFEDRNPVWLCGGIEVDSPKGKLIKWSQPEIILYDDDTYIRMSYPDLIEEDGKYFLTETQKNIARVHEIDPALLEGLWNQFGNKSIVRDGLLLELPKMEQAIPKQVDMPELKSFLVRSGRKADYGTDDLRTGFAIDLWLHLKTLSAGQILLDNRKENGQGWCLQTTERGTVEIILNDGRTENRWDCDPGLLQKGKLHHIAINVDGGPKIITFIIDGKLCDGADYRQFGWGRFSPNLYHVNGDKMLRIAPDLKGEVKSLHIYNRCLTTSEAIGNYQAGL
ncbi:MAG: exo-alpha-sialidase [Bacteroidota bacterium]|nr:exo-alpha-sialidase [Bacteroidota bacterium]